MSETSPPRVHLHEHLKSLREQLRGPYSHLPVKSSVTVLMKHGGFQILTKPGAVLTRLSKHLKRNPDEALAALAAQVGNTAAAFFTRLCPKRYGVPSELISHLTFPHEGRTYTEPTAPELENPNLPAVFTFVGQFIDHDLTFNGANLFDDQTGGAVVNFASPFVDLDSVYGQRSYPKSPPDPSLKDIINNKLVYNDDKSFKLRRLGPNAYDVTRWTDPAQPDRVGSAFIFDPRNDENQLILQIHILIMRVHNKLLGQIYKNDPKLDPEKALQLTRLEVVANWQSVLLNDYLPRVCEPDVLADVLKNIVKSDRGNLKYKPPADGPLQMPHEFAIGFRFGHSMLRTAYRLNALGAVQLFNNRDLARHGDLRGGRDLSRDHVIDWDIFYPKHEFDASLSLKIDSKVTPVVFDLPESAIPDAIKTNGNLPYRNLTRSREIDLACGEDLADFFDIPKLNRFQVEPDDTTHFLFEADVDTFTPDGGRPSEDQKLTGVKNTQFKTPLWYYILKEAEVLENGERLGPLGSRLIAEVIAGGIFYGYDTKFDFGWRSQITGGNQVKLRDLIDFVDETPPKLITSVND